MRYTAIILFSLLFCACSPEKAPNDWGKMGLKGKVRSLTEITYDLSDTTSHPQRKYRWKYIYTFDQHGKLQEFREYDDENDTDVTLKRVYNYDALGLPSLELSYARNELVSKTIYTKDSTSNAVVNKRSPSSESITPINICQYDGRRLPVRMQYYSSLHKLQRQDLFKYDDNKNKIEYIALNADSFRQRTLYYYDHGNLVKEISDTARTYQPKLIIHKYDSHGNETEESAFDAVGSLLSKKNMKYQKTDPAGNWLIKVTCWKSLKPTLVERAISYY